MLFFLVEFAILIPNNVFVNEFIVSQIELKVKSEDSYEDRKKYFYCFYT